MNFLEIELGLRQSPLFQELFEVIESGDFERFESEAKRQHFIPQFLLRGLGRLRVPPGPMVALASLPRSSEPLPGWKGVPCIPYQR